MGGAVEGSLFEGGQGFDRRVADLSETDMKDLYHMNPDWVVDIAERAILAGNPELPVFIAGMLMARSLERPLQPSSWATRKNVLIRGHNHPSERHSHESYRQAVRRVLPLLETPVPQE